MSATTKKIFFITRPSVQSLLLLDWLSTELETSLVLLDIKKPVMFYASESALFLYDIEASTRKADTIWPRLITESCTSVNIFLINSPKTRSFYEKSLWPTPKNILHENCPPEVLAASIKDFIYNEDKYVSNTPVVVPADDNYSPETNGLTERECEILHELCKGESNMQIAKTFFISENTVRTHLYNIFKKISVNNRTQAVNWANNRFRLHLQPAE